MTNIQGGGRADSGVHQARETPDAHMASRDTRPRPRVGAGAGKERGQALSHAFTPANPDTQSGPAVDGRTQRRRRPRRRRTAFRKGRPRTYGGQPRHRFAEREVSQETPPQAGVSPVTTTVTTLK